MLADYGQTGSFGVQGDVNLDGVVNVQDVLTILAGFGASGSNTITGSLTVSASGNLPAFGVTGSTDLTGSLLLDGPAIVSGTLDLTGATTINDVLTVIAGFNASGSTNISGSVVMRDVSSQGAGAYFEHSGLSSGGSLSLKLGDIDSLGTGNGTKIIIDDANENVTITGSLDVTGNQIDFTNLPTADPGVSGRLYTQSGSQLPLSGSVVELNAISGSKFVLIS